MILNHESMIRFEADGVPGGGKGIDEETLLKRRSEWIADMVIAGLPTTIPINEKNQREETPVMTRKFSIFDLLPKHKPKK